MIEIPVHLHDADRTLTKYGQWAKDRMTFGRCGSAEGRYRSTDVHHGVAAPVVLIADWSAADVQRSLNVVPETYRRILTAWYVPGRGQQRRMRMVRKGVHRDQFANLLLDALTMFKNVHRSISV